MADISRSAAVAEARRLPPVFGIWKAPPVPVEVFGGFKLAVDGRWREVGFFTSEPVEVGEETVYALPAVELVRLLHSFGSFCTRSVERRT